MSRRVRLRSLRGIRAFDTNALDYLLKPFIDERFEATMARVKARLNERGLGEFGQRMIHMASKIGKRIDFLNAQSGVPCTAEETENRFSVFTGQVPSKWRPHLPLSCRVRFRLIYPGVDLIYYGNARIWNTTVISRFRR
jgi:hypothetical protein